MNPVAVMQEEFDTLISRSDIWEGYISWCLQLREEFKKSSGQRTGERFSEIRWLQRRKQTEYPFHRICLFLPWTQQALCSCIFHLHAHWGSRPLTLLLFGASCPNRDLVSPNNNQPLVGPLLELLNLSLQIMYSGYWLLSHHIPLYTWWIQIVLIRTTFLFWSTKYEGRLFILGTGKVRSRLLDLATISDIVLPDCVPQWSENRNKYCIF